MIQTVGVYHIGIAVDDLDRAERFYKTILGMSGGHRIAEGGPGSSVEMPTWCFFYAHVH